MSRQISLARLREIGDAVAGGTSVERMSATLGVPHVTLWTWLNRRGLPTRRAALLSKRESQVVTLRAEGVRNPEIARRLGIAVRAVETVLVRANRKIDAAMMEKPVPRAFRPTWEPEIAARFGALIAGGMGIRAAGREVGVGANAAIGKWHRIQKAEARNG